MYRTNIKCPRCGGNDTMYEEYHSSNALKRSLFTVGAVVLFVVGILSFSVFHFLGIACMAIAVALGKSRPALENKMKRKYKCGDCGYRWHDID